MADRSLYQKTLESFHQRFRALSGAKSGGDLSSFYFFAPETSGSKIIPYLTTNRDEIVRLVCSACKFADERASAFAEIFDFALTEKAHRPEYFPRLGSRGCRRICVRALSIAWAQIVHESYSCVSIIKTSDYGEATKELSRLREKGYVFRGDTSYHYGLIPSCFRGLDEGKSLDRETLLKIYCDSGVLKRYEDYFGTVNQDALQQFYEYMQHSMSFSPSLDFTDRWQVAFSFALCRGANLSDYANRPAKITAIHFENPEESLPKGWDFKVTKLKSDFNFADYIIKEGFHSLAEIKDRLTPRFHVIKSKDNDRMKIQSGILVFLEQAYIVGNYLPWFFASNISISEIRLPLVEIGNRKREFMDEFLKKNRQYSYDCLMDPYKYIGGMQ